MQEAQGMQALKPASDTALTSLQPIPSHLWACKCLALAYVAAYKVLHRPVAAQQSCSVQALRPYALLLALALPPGRV